MVSDVYTDSCRLPRMQILNHFFFLRAFFTRGKEYYTYLVTNVVSVASLALQKPLMGLNPLWQDLLHINLCHLLLVLLGCPHDRRHPFIKHRLGRRMIHLDLGALPNVVAHPTVLVAKVGFDGRELCELEGVT